MIGLTTRKDWDFAKNDYTFEYAAYLYCDKNGIATFQVYEKGSNKSVSETITNNTKIRVIVNNIKEDTESKNKVEYWIKKPNYEWKKVYTSLDLISNNSDVYIDSSVHKVDSTNGAFKNLNYVYNSQNTTKKFEVVVDNEPIFTEGTDENWNESENYINIPINKKSKNIRIYSDPKRKLGLSQIEIFSKKKYYSKNSKMNESEALAYSNDCNSATTFKYKGFQTDYCFSNRDCIENHESDETCYDNGFTFTNYNLLKNNNKVKKCDFLKETNEKVYPKKISLDTCKNLCNDPKTFNEDNGTNLNYWGENDCKAFEWIEENWCEEKNTMCKGSNKTEVSVPIKSRYSGDKIHKIKAFTECKNDSNCTAVTKKNNKFYKCYDQNYIAEDGYTPDVIFKKECEKNGSCILYKECYDSNEDLEIGISINGYTFRKNKIKKSILEDKQIYTYEANSNKACKNSNSAEDYLGDVYPDINRETNNEYIYRLSSSQELCNKDINCNGMYDWNDFGGGWPRCYNTDNVTTSSGAMTYKKVYNGNISNKYKRETKNGIVVDKNSEFLISTHGSYPKPTHKLITEKNDCDVQEKDMGNKNSIEECITAVKNDSESKTKKYFVYNSNNKSCKWKKGSCLDESKWKYSNNYNLYEIIEPTIVEDNGCSSQFPFRTNISEDGSGREFCYKYEECAINIENKKSSSSNYDNNCKKEEIDLNNPVGGFCNSNDDCMSNICDEQKNECISGSNGSPCSGNDNKCLSNKCLTNCCSNNITDNCKKCNNQGICSECIDNYSFKYYKYNNFISNLPTWADLYKGLKKEGIDQIYTLYKNAHSSYIIEKIYKIWYFEYGSDSNIKYCRVYFKVKEKWGSNTAYWNRLFKYNESDQTWSYHRSSTTPNGSIRASETSSNLPTNDGYTYTLVYQNNDMCKADNGKSCNNNSKCHSNKCLVKCCKVSDPQCTECDDNGDCKTCSSNYELNTSKQCKLKKGMACTNSNQCSSNNCKTNCCESSTCNNTCDANGACATSNEFDASKERPDKLVNYSGIQSAPLINKSSRNHISSGKLYYEPNPPKVYRKAYKQINKCRNWMELKKERKDNPNVDLKKYITTNLTSDDKNYCRNPDNDSNGSWCYYVGHDEYTDDKGKKKVREDKSRLYWSYCAPAIANCEPIEGHSCSNRSWVYLRGGFTYSGCHNKEISSQDKETDSCGNEIGKKAWVYCNEKPTTMVDTNANHRFYVYTGDDYLCPRGGSIVNSDECTKASNWVYDNLGLKHVAKDQTAFTNGSDRCISKSNKAPGCYYEWRDPSWKDAKQYVEGWGYYDTSYQNRTKLYFNNNYRSQAEKNNKKWSGGTGITKDHKYRLLCKGTCNNCDPSLPASNTNSCNNDNNKYPNCKN